MRKQWFDKRAEDGGYWTVVVQKWEDFEYTYHNNSASYLLRSVERIRYEPRELIKVKRRPTMGGKMKQEEAIAMAKLLNATLGESE